MKLKCVTHNRRVFSNGDHFSHRTGDVGRCDSQFATIGELVYTLVPVGDGVALGVIPFKGTKNFMSSEDQLRGKNRSQDYITKLARLLENPELKKAKTEFRRYLDENHPSGINSFTFIDSKPQIIKEYKYDH